MNSLQSPSPTVPLMRPSAGVSPPVAGREPDEPTPRWVRGLLLALGGALLAGAVIGASVWRGCGVMPRGLQMAGCALLAGALILACPTRVIRMGGAGLLLFLPGTLMTTAHGGAGGAEACAPMLVQIPFLLCLLLYLALLLCLPVPEREAVRIPTPPPADHCAGLPRCRLPHQAPRPPRRTGETPHGAASFSSLPAWLDARHMGLTALLGVSAVFACAQLGVAAAQASSHRLALWTAGFGLCTLAGIAASASRQAWGAVLLLGIYFGTPRVLAAHLTGEQPAMPGTALHMIIGYACVAITLYQAGGASFPCREPEHD